MAAGIRVIRGPDWSKGDEDGGEGHVGTVLQYGSNGTAEVVWDSGQNGTYRIGQGGKHELCILDNATVGVRHTKICDGCTENGILGIRWKCAKCDDIDLCSVCYVTDKHDLTHPFLCIEAVGAEPVQVSQRNRSMKVRALGIYPDAVVVRGRDWKWGNQDGGPGRRGTVTSLKTPESRSARSTVGVKWDTGEENTYRVGHHGAVDLKYIDQAPGPEYYPKHLPQLDARKTTLPSQGGSTDAGIQEGDKVCIELDEASLRELQKAAGGWSAGMSQLIGKVGVVKGFSQTGDASVEFGTQKWRIVPTALRKIPKLKLGDVVEIIDDEGKVKTLQEDHGGWLDVMASKLGKRGRVVKIDSDGDVAVKFGSSVFLYNPACCIKVEGAVVDDDDDNDDDDDDDDEGETLTESEADLLRLQIGGGFANFIAGLALLEALNDAQQQAGTAVFIKAIVEGDTGAVRSFLQQDSDLANAVHAGIPALNVAAHEGKADIVKLLIEKGANKNSRDKDGDTALNLSVCRQHSNIAEFLVRLGADVNIPNQKKRSPLHNAAYTGQAGVVKLLLARNCEVNTRDLDGDTALMDAIGKGHSDVVLVLLTSPKVDLRVTNNKGFAPIHTAALKGNSNIVERLALKNRSVVNMGKEDGFTAAHIASLNDHDDVMKVLIKHNSDLNAKTNIGQTPLHLACMKAHIDCVQLLVENRANVNVADKDGDTPLHMAMMLQTGNLMLRLLIGQHPQLDEETRVRIATYLIQHRANPNARNKQNKTPSEVCASQRIKEAVAAFQKTSAQARPTSPDGRPLLCTKCMNVRANALYLPCGHKDTCVRCCKNVRKCGICGKDVSKRVDEEGKKVSDDCVLQ